MVHSTYNLPIEYLVAKHKNVAQPCNNVSRRHTVLNYTGQADTCSTAPILTFSVLERLLHTPPEQLVKSADTQLQMQTAAE